MTRDLTDQVIIVTGASSGIGAATARACAAAGMRLVLNARRADRLEEVAEGVRGLGGEAVVVVGDVVEPALPERLLDAALDRYGRFDVVFANAGYGLTRSVLETSDAELREMFDVNFFSGVALLRTAARRLIEARRPGHLLMCSSCLSKFALPLNGAYSASKAAQGSICSALRHELRGRGVYVSSVHPITTTTEFFDLARGVPPGAGGDHPDHPDHPDHVPGFLVQTPERVARAVVRCLRRPCPEVWTSTLVRTVAGFMTMSPRFYDHVIRRQTASELAAVEAPGR